MTHIRLRLRRGFRANVVEVPAGDILLGSHPDCDVVVAGAGERHARLLPRRGRLLLAPVVDTPRRPAVDGTRIDAPIILGDSAVFALADVHITPKLVFGSPSLAGRPVGPWICGEEVGSALLLRRVHAASGPEGPGRVHHLPASVAWENGPPPGTTRVEDGLAWFELGLAGIALDTLLDAHDSRAVRWPEEAAIVIVTQLVEALCAFHTQRGVHGALRPELVWLDVEGRLSLMGPDPTARSLDYQPEAVRMGAPPDQASDLFAWWRLAHEVLARFAALAAVRSTLPIPPPNVTALLEAAEGVRRWAVGSGLDPTATHVARGVRVAERTPPVAWQGKTSDENRAQRG